jgi:predicted dehydrogenase
MSKINRRRFLHHSFSAAAGVIAAPALLRSQSPNSKLGVAVVGVGGRGNSHLSAFVGDSRTEVRFIVDVDEKIGNDRCDQIEKKQGVRPRLVKDMRQALDSKDVDILSCATPNHWHALSGVWAMQAGKDVYVEKPVSHNIAEGSALIAASRKYRRICQVGTQCRSNPAIQDAVEWMQSGGMGEVKFARGLCYKRRKSIGSLGDYPIPEVVDFDLWSGPAPYTSPKVTRGRFHYDWHWQRHYGNGDSGNQGPHQTDIARWGLGLDRHPNNIISYGGRLGYQAERNDASYIDAGDTANTQVSIYDYGDKSIVFETRGLDVNDSDDEEINRLFKGSRGNKIGVVFYGTYGYLLQRSYTHCIAYDKNFNVVKEFRGGGNHFGNFIDACVSGRRSDLNADVREGHLSAALSHLGNISYSLGEDNKVSIDQAQEILSGIKSLDGNLETLDRTMKHLVKNGVDLKKYPISMGPNLEFDPDKEVFPHSKAATTLVGREYRKGFVCPTAEFV